ncbi:uncharacterized protein RCC_08880 [Ramularia collo-cygni]|uniref:Uncharacterized protein n=1 Tax=Ramularia collo-cygni TaxID=112498 RepID=A0A2D3V8C5_9PEZI|nr:uncharacterized protein RCC_08880 [Ramularia collo-cygni]CZT23170.1 uncharacterized protein RCC_08880 [Ramularia collo-cygni]
MIHITLSLAIGLVVTQARPQIAGIPSIVPRISGQLPSTIVTGVPKATIASSPNLQLTIPTIVALTDKAAIASLLKQPANSGLPQLSSALRVLSNGYVSALPTIPQSIPVPSIVPATGIALPSDSIPAITDLALPSLSAPSATPPAIIGILQEIGNDVFLGLAGDLSSLLSVISTAVASPTAAPGLISISAPPLSDLVRPTTGVSEAIPTAVKRDAEAEPQILGALLSALLPQAGNPQPALPTPPVPLISGLSIPSIQTGLALPSIISLPSTLPSSPVSIKDLGSVVLNIVKDIPTLLTTVLAEITPDLANLTPQQTSEAETALAFLNLLSLLDPITFRGFSQLTDLAAVHTFAEELPPLDFLTVVEALGWRRLFFSTSLDPLLKDPVKFLGEIGELQPIVENLPAAVSFLVLQQLGVADVLGSLGLDVPDV